MIFLCLSISVVCFGQELELESAAADQELLQEFEQYYDRQDHRKQRYREMAAKQGSSEIRMLLSSLFLMYKNFVSTQDGQSCSFHPSCSEYSLLSIQKHGVVLGVLSGFDRLTRCNPLSPENYTLHEASGMLYDPVD